MMVKREKKVKKLFSAILRRRGKVARTLSGFEPERRWIPRNVKAGLKGRWKRRGLRREKEKETIDTMKRMFSSD